jgi:hypothetical protein
MSTTRKAAALPWTPQFFLSALGSGGLSVSFFMYLMFATPHPKQPIPSFSTVLAAYGDGSMAMKAIIIAALIGMLFFGAMHVRMMAWNLVRFGEWKATEAAMALRSGNGESQLMALPLALAMSVNVTFIFGAVFIPGVWENVEWLFPLALAAFGAVGALAAATYARFVSRVFTEGGFDCAKNNSFGQMMGAFAFGMVGVGFSATAAMSKTLPVVLIGWAGAAAFLVTGIFFAVIFTVIGFRSMMENKAARDTLPTLLNLVPFLTVIGIGFYRLFMSMEHNFGAEWHPASRFSFLMLVFALQLAVLASGTAVIVKARYFADYVFGALKSPASFGLVCPGVGLFVSANFVINAGLVAMGAVDKYSAVWVALYVPAVMLQLATAWLYLKLNARLIPDATPKSAPTLQAA